MIITSLTRLRSQQGTNKLTTIFLQNLKIILMGGKKRKKYSASFCVSYTAYIQFSWGEM